MYNTKFTGNFVLVTPLKPHHLAYLKAFHDTFKHRADTDQLARRSDVLRKAVGLPLGVEGAYFVGEELKYNDPACLSSEPEGRSYVQGQPGDRCCWLPTEDGQAIIHDGKYGSVHFVEWLQYLLDHFLMPWGYVLTGEVCWYSNWGSKTNRQEEGGKIVVHDNRVSVSTLQPDGSYSGERREEIGCIHKDATVLKTICVHLVGELQARYYRWFTGNVDQVEYTLVCSACYQRLVEDDRKIELRPVCQRCCFEIERCGNWCDRVSTVAFGERAGEIRLVLETVSVPLQNTLLALQPVSRLRESVWIALTAGGQIMSIDLSAQSVTNLLLLPVEVLDLTQQIDLFVSPDGNFAALAEAHGQQGVVVDLRTGQITMVLERDDYHVDVSRFPLAFFVLDERLFLVHGTEWNRLDISDPATGMLITQRSTPQASEGKRSEHYLDYFHCGLLVSPDQERMIDNGWAWHPIGVVVTYQLRTWLYENVWETEDTSVADVICNRTYYWDGPLCWIDQWTLAVWGYGDDEAELIPAVRLFDVVEKKELRWFPGPNGNLAYDKHLFSFSKQAGLAVWDVATGERLLSHPDFRPSLYHPGTRQFLQIGENGTFVIGTLSENKGEKHGEK